MIVVTAAHRSSVHRLSNTPQPGAPICRDSPCSTKGKPVARRGRKARGLSETAQPPRHIHHLFDTEVESLMPLVIHPRIRRNARRVALMTALACFGATGSALAACPTAPTTEPFTQFGDTADYSLAPGGSFENGAAGWLLNGNILGSGNESFLANSNSD